MRYPGRVRYAGAAVLAVGGLIGVAIGEEWVLDKAEYDAAAGVVLCWRNCTNLPQIITGQCPKDHTCCGFTDCSTGIRTNLTCCSIFFPCELVNINGVPTARCRSSW